MEILRNQEFSDKTEKFTKSSTTSIRHFSIFFLQVLPERNHYSIVFGSFLTQRLTLRFIEPSLPFIDNRLTIQKHHYFSNLQKITVKIDN